VERADNRIDNSLDIKEEDVYYDVIIHFTGFIRILNLFFSTSSACYGTPICSSFHSYQSTWNSLCTYAYLSFFC